MDAFCTFCTEELFIISGGSSFRNILFRPVEGLERCLFKTRERTVSESQFFVVGRLLFLCGLFVIHLFSVKLQYYLSFLFLLKAIKKAEVDSIWQSVLPQHSYCVQLRIISTSSCVFRRKLSWCNIQLRVLCLCTLEIFPAISNRL